MTKLQSTFRYVKNHLGKRSTRGTNKMLTWITISICAIIINYFIITTIADIILMGKLHFQIADKSVASEFLITRENNIDIQNGFECSGYSSAYVLRHHGKEALGNIIYDEIPHKMKSGYAYPKGISELFRGYGFNVKYCRGNLNVLKQELCEGNPVIVLIRVYPDKDWLHYVPVVGYDDEGFFFAESLPELVNSENEFYNRKVKNEDFIRLWDTAMIRQPLYKNTYYKIVE